MSALWGPVEARVCGGVPALTRGAHRDRPAASLGQGMWEQEPDGPAGLQVSEAGAQARTRSFPGEGRTRGAAGGAGLGGRDCRAVDVAVPGVCRASGKSHRVGRAGGSLGSSRPELPVVGGT